MPQRNHASRARVRIMVADRRDLVRAGLRTVLESVPQWRVAGEAASGPAAVELVRRLEVNVAIVDVGLPSMDGLGVIARIREVASRTLTILVGPHEDRDLADRARDAGAQGLLTDASSAAEIVAEVRSALRRCSGAAADPFPVGARPHLTARELDVIRLVAAGCSTAITGETLGISAKTVEQHRHNIMRKMDLDSIVEVVHYAVRERIIAL